MSYFKHSVFLLLITFSLGIKNTWADNPVVKLSRGLENVATSPAEFPIQYIRLDHEGKSIAVTTLAGTFYGVYWTAARLVGGLVETATFFLPVPENYAPMMNPPTPLDSARNQAQKIAQEGNQENPDKPY